MDLADAKQAAAESAVVELPPSGIIGLGTGSTTKFFIEEVGRLVAAGREFRAVPTSEASRRQAESLKIPVLDDAGPWDIAVTVDGADEVDAQLNLVKGGGGAHTREKIVNYASRRNVIIVDRSKVSERLGTTRAVPIEVLRFGHLCTLKALSQFGKPVLRALDGRPVLTDTGNYIYDVQTGPIADAKALDRELHRVPGVVETGLFIGRADVVIVADGHDIRRLLPS